MVQIHLIIVFLTVYYANTVSAAKECYQCSTSVSLDCRDLIDTTNLQKCKSTTQDEVNCIMYKYLMRNRLYLYRGCKNKKDTCDDAKMSLAREGKNMTECSLCNTDLCKAAAFNNLPISMSTVILVGFSILLN